MNTESRELSQKAIFAIHEMKSTIQSLPLKEQIDFLKEDIELIYHYWLLDNYPDEIHTSEDHLKAVESRLYYDLYLKSIIEVEE